MQTKTNNKYRGRFFFNENQTVSRKFNIDDELANSIKNISYNFFILIRNDYDALLLTLPLLKCWDKKFSLMTKSRTRKSMAQQEIKVKEQMPL